MTKPQIQQTIELQTAPIGFFDSGVGGLTVFEKVKQLLPNENYIYFGDLKNIPYGEKSKEQLIGFAENIFRFFEEKGAKAVVMACNTTSATVYDALKDNYGFKIYPIIQSCAKIISGMDVKKIGIFATNATIQSGAYSRELLKHNPYLDIFGMSCPEWVSIVEENTQNTTEGIEVIEKYLKKMLANSPDKIILGCTHYPYLLDSLTKFASKELFIDPSFYFAEFIKKDLSEHGLLNNSIKAGYEEFFVSANPEQFQMASGMFYPVNAIPKIV